MPSPLIPLSHLTEPAQPERKYRLMEIVRRRMRERRYSRRTDEAYIGWIRRYILFSGRRHPADLDAADVQGFLLDLAVRQGVSVSTQNQALAAINFLYASVLQKPLAPVEGVVPAIRPKRLPVVLSAGEVKSIIGRLRDPARFVVSLLYGSGLRVLECVSLRIKDIDLERREITVRGGKGNKDRRVPLAESALSDMRRAMRSSELRWRNDRRRGVRVTGIGGALPKKLPNAERDWSWYYLFPASRSLSTQGEF